jgi:D-beta-D-heptose 7-phosphate kinase/D-beta-D-heptose 1-phosphate adenosyltransferase
MPNTLLDLAEALTRSRVLCIGDVILDHFIWGMVDRISPEAPVPVLQVESEEQRLGGAGNVLRNLHALGCTTSFVSVVGSDTAGCAVASMIDELADVEAYVLHQAEWTTSVKTRLIAGTQQLLRADLEQIRPLLPELRARILDRVRATTIQYRHIIVSDYAKGVLGKGLAREIITIARAAGATVVVDPKNPNYAVYRGANVIKPNLRELSAAVGRPLATEELIIAGARALMSEHELEAILVSRGKDGMLLVERQVHHILPSTAREVYDVTGAGDTASAALTAALAAGASLKEAAELANEAAGTVVGKIGTAVVSGPELVRVLAERDAVGRAKLLPLGLVLDYVARWRRKGLKVGFTNGCFDILHPGHISLLREARAACDRLIVGLNSDASVRRLKGPGRPVQDGDARASIVSSLPSVDLVVMFDEDTPISLIEAIRPDLLVKGADYKAEEVIGYDLVASYGGRVLLAQLVPGQSTSSIISRRKT